MWASTPLHSTNPNGKDNLRPCMASKWHHEPGLGWGACAGGGLSGLHRRFQVGSTRSPWIKCKAGALAVALALALAMVGAGMID